MTHRSSQGYKCKQCRFHTTTICHATMINKSPLWTSILNDPNITTITTTPLRSQESIKKRPLTNNQSNQPTLQTKSMTIPKPGPSITIHHIKMTRLSTRIIILHTFPRTTTRQIMQIIERYVSGSFSAAAAQAYAAPHMSVKVLEKEE